MFFPQLLNIDKNDLVLEIGPGSIPYWRANVLADKFDNSDFVIQGNFGDGGLITQGKPFFKIIDNKLPFKNDAFDYVICSHGVESSDPDG